MSSGLPISNSGVEGPSWVSSLAKPKVAFPLTCMAALFIKRVSPRGYVTHGAASSFLSKASAVGGMFAAYSFLKSAYKLKGLLGANEGDTIFDRKIAITTIKTVQYFIYTFKALENHLGRNLLKGVPLKHKAFDFTSTAMAVFDLAFVLADIQKVGKAKAAAKASSTGSKLIKMTLGKKRIKNLLFCLASLKLCLQITNEFQN